jgi:GTPase
MCLNTGHALLLVGVGGHGLMGLMTVTGLLTVGMREKGKGSTREGKRWEKGRKKGT